MLTPFGREVRKLRIDNNMTLSKMAEELDVSPTFLTAIETGRKSIPANFPERVAAVLGNSTGILGLLKKAAEISKDVHKIVMGSSSTSHDREVAALFARQFSDLSEVTKNEIKKILENEQKRK